MNFEVIRPIANPALEEKIRTRLDSLTKPPGSLGRLEGLALQVGLIQGTDTPEIGHKAIVVFCGDHGIVEEKVSPYPMEVTAQMLANFRAGGAAVNVMCRQMGIEPVIVDMGVGHPTHNFLYEPAMSREAAQRAIEKGMEYADCGDTLGVGEMGIGNTTSAAAIFSAFSGLDPSATTGRGTGVSNGGLTHKIEVIRGAMARRRPDPGDPIGVLAEFGGYEIAGITGLILRAASQRKLVILDGFITGAAAMVAWAMEPSVLDYLLFSHRSAEAAHQRMLDFLGVKPLFDMEMRLGEGTGTALGMTIVESSVLLYREMATFNSAGVSTAAS